ncbi:hypothetical protein HBA55_26075 [Pseudomaricurvus alkylphenolicus]|uniref:MAE_28990/MAE_18760 family HEPN-like nuclease n=1 Tax=Pseudomaricurvus alkylphenolicus TaxID=1306991 RepID=UPI00141F38DE|nr:MAE_28990/MAE_18760 family HEPN-like nuclease [Pseudomaricurvus alkylphenolicus]NIB43104.1 hypothetical protein [Pseudomaricurvus alkylphenolicus]
MDQIIEDLDDRKSELDEYLRLIEFLNASRSLSNDQGAELEVSSLLVKTTKGSVYLLLYNLVEATMRGAVVAIHDNISSSGATFNDLRETLQSKILYRAKRDKISIKSIISGTRGDLALNLHEATLNSKDLFSGNIDGGEIKKVAEVYGFSSNTHFPATGHGRHLSAVKQNRNDLAHGNKTFSVVGSGTTIEELRELSDEVISYIYEISDNIVDSLESRTYLRP